MGRFNGKAALVTGSSSGIGYEIARALVEEGARVAVNSRSVERANEARHRLMASVAGVVDATPGTILACPGDISTEAGARDLVHEAAQGLGRLDVLVNAAGIPLICPAEQLSGEKWKQCLDTNLAGTFFCCREAWQHMRLEGGSIVNIASVAALAALPFRVAYAASKAGVVALTKTLACEWAGQGIRVNAVAPGFIATPLDSLAAASSAGYSEDDIRARTPLGRKGTPREVAMATLYLASDEAAFVTGDTLVVDGGWLSFGAWGNASPLSRTRPAAPD